MQTRDIGEHSTTKFFIALLFCLLLCVEQKAQAESACLIPLRIFHLPQEWDSWTFAPDGQHLTWLEPYTGKYGGEIYFGSITSPKKKTLLAQTESLNDMKWNLSGHSLLICTHTKTLLVQFDTTYTKQTMRELPVQWSQGVRINFRARENSGRNCWCPNRVADIDQVHKRTRLNNGRPADAQFGR